MTQEPGENKLIVGLYNRKVNDDRLGLPFGFVIEHDKTSQKSMVRRISLNSVPDQAEHLPIKVQARSTLLRVGKMTLKELALATGLKQSSLYSKLYDMQREGEARCVDNYWSIIQTS